MFAKIIAFSKKGVHFSKEKDKDRENQNLNITIYGGDNPSPEEVEARESIETIKDLFAAKLTEYYADPQIDFYQKYKKLIDPILDKNPFIDVENLIDKIASTLAKKAVEKELNLCAQYGHKPGITKPDMSSRPPQKDPDESPNKTEDIFTDLYLKFL